jgi:outer membrane protein assembly factor BamB
MKQQAYVLALAFVAACSANGPSSLPAESAHAGVGIDQSWTRLAFAPWPSYQARQVARFDTGFSRASHQWFPPPDAPSQPPSTQPSPDNALDWQYMVQAPVHGTPALFVLGTQGDPNDRLFAYGNVGGSNYLAAVNDLYATSPSIAWYIPLDSEVDGSAISISVDGGLIFAVTKAGTVYAVDNTVSVPQAPKWTYSLPNSVSWASPWLDFQSTPNSLYLADEGIANGSKRGGHVTKLDASTGAMRWISRVCAKPIHSSPIVWNNIVWVGCDDGQLYRLDPATGDAYSPATNLCANPASCGTNDAIYSGPAIDVSNNRLILGVNNRVIQIDISPTTGCSTGNQACAFSARSLPTSAIFYSSPVIDAAGGYVYASFNNKLWRAPYTAANGITDDFSGKSLKGSNANQGYPKSGPMVFNGHVWVGDGGGYVNRFSSIDFSSEAVTPRYGTTIDTTPVVDYLGGNIYYGTNGAGNANTPVNPNSGSWVQLTQTWTYP